MFVGGGTNNTVAPVAVSVAVSDEVMDADGNNTQASVTPFAFGAKNGMYPLVLCPSSQICTFFPNSPIKCMHVMCILFCMYI